MSKDDVRAFFDRYESDRDFADKLERLVDDPEAVLAAIRAEGYDVAPDDVRDEFLERYGAELTPDQLELVAAGLSTEAEIAIGVTLGILGAVGIGVALVAAVAG